MVATSGPAVIIAVRQAMTSTPWVRSTGRRSGLRSGRRYRIIPIIRILMVRMCHLHGIFVDRRQEVPGDRPSFALRLDNRLSRRDGGRSDVPGRRGTFGPPSGRRLAGAECLIRGLAEGSGPSSINPKEWCPAGWTYEKGRPPN